MCIRDSDKVEVGNGQAGAPQRLAGGLDRADAHDGRVAADRAERTDLDERLEAVRLHIILGRDNHRGAGIVDAGGVARSDGTVLLERRTQLGQAFQRCLLYTSRCV